MDTNVIMGLLCPSAWQHRISRDLVNITRSLGVNLAITKKTEQEFLNVLEESNNNMQNLDADPKFLKSVDDDFISSFAQEIELAPKQAWKKYYYRMRQLSANLQKNYGIGYYKEIREDITNAKSFTEVAKKVSSCYKKMRGTEKEREIAEHDAYHMILVKDIRKTREHPTLGPDYWFLTHDQTLICAEDFINEKLKCKDTTLASMVASLWLQMVSPFLSITAKKKTASDIFSDLLKSKFAVIPFRMPVDHLANIQGEWLKYDWLETEEVQELLNKRFVRSYAAKIHDALVRGEKVEPLKSEFNQKLYDDLNAMVTQKMKSYDQKIGGLEEKLELEIKEGKQTTKKLEKEEKFKKIWRTVSGIFGCTLLSVNFLVLLLHMLPWDAFTVSYLLGTSVIGAILLMIAIAYERVKVSLEGKI